MKYMLVGQIGTQKYKRVLEITKANNHLFADNPQVMKTTGVKRAMAEIRKEHKKSKKPQAGKMFEWSISSMKSGY